MLNIFIRGILLYLSALVVTRLMGKRQVGQMQPFELVISLLVADLAAAPMGDVGVPIFYGFVPLFAILIVHQVFSFLMMHSVHMRTLICGKPSILVQKGEVDERQLRIQRVNMDDLVAQLRNQGFVRMQDIETAVLETNGNLSVLPVAHERPVTPEDLNIYVSPTSMPISLILDGRVYGENLNKAGHDRYWLQTKLAQKGLKPKDVLLALYYPSTHELHIQPKSQRRSA